MLDNVHKSHEYGINTTPGQPSSNKVILKSRHDLQSSMPTFQVSIQAKWGSWYPLKNPLWVQGRAKSTFKPMTLKVSKQVLQKAPNTPCKAYFKPQNLKVGVAKAFQHPFFSYVKASVGKLLQHLVSNFEVWGPDSIVSSCLYLIHIFHINKIFSNTVKHYPINFQRVKDFSFIYSDGFAFKIPQK